MTKFLGALALLLLFIAPSIAQKPIQKQEAIHALQKDALAFQSHGHDYQIDAESLIKKFRTSNRRSGAAHLQRAKLTESLCELKASEYVANTFVRPPSNFMKPETSSRGANSNSSTLRINYNFIANISPERQAQFINAFEYAAAIWESQLSGNFPVIVDANFQSLSPGVLGSAGANFIWRDDFPGAPWYGEALAQEVFNQELSDATTPDINSNFNTDFGWYLGTDGNPPPGTYDFVTVVLHELGHGLGFFGSANAIPGLGVYGFLGSPFIYDTYVEDVAGNGIGDIAAPGVVTPLLGPYLQGNDLFINSPSQNSPNPIFTPNPFQRGSSYSHWDEATFTFGTPNSLMTPQLGFQEAIHDPGENTLAMFQDHGWIPSEDGVGPISQDLGERCNITGISPDPNFPPFLCDNPGVFSADGGVFGPVGSHVMCFRVEGIDPFNQPLDPEGYQVKIGGKDYPIVFLGYDFDGAGEQYFLICVGGIESNGIKNVSVKIKLASGCTFTQGRFYNSPDCQEEQSLEVSNRGGEYLSSELMTISPNPSHGDIFIELNLKSAGNFIIQNNMGQKIFHQVTKGKENMSIDLKGNPSGIYFASYILENQIVTKKFILK